MPYTKTMKKKRFLLFLSITALAVFLTPARACADAFTPATAPAMREGNSFFFLSDASVDDFDKNIFCAKSSVRAENLKGDAYIIFSDLRLSGDFDGRVYSLFSTVTVYSRDPAKPAFVRSFFGLPALGRWNRADGAWVFNGVPPGWALALAGRGLRLAFILGLAALKKSFFAQGAAFLLKSPVKTARNGLLFCFGAAAVTAVFLLSAVGIPLAALAFFAFTGAALAGEASLGLAACKILCAKVLIKKPIENSLGIYVKIIIGVMIIELSRMIPFFSYFADWALLPVLCSGAVLTALYEGFVRKVFLAYD